MCRITLPLDPKRSDGRITYNSREKEDSLSLRKIKFEATGYFFFPSPPRFLFLCFIHSSLLFYSFLFSHLIFSSFSHFLWSFSLPFWSNHSFGQKEEISSPFPQTKGVAITFPSLFPYFLNPLYDIITTWLNVSHGIHFPHMANCEPFFQCQVSLSYGAMWHPQPCHVSSDIPRLEKCEIPTTSEFNEIRRDC